MQKCKLRDFCYLYVDHKNNKIYLSQMALPKRNSNKMESFPLNLQNHQIQFSQPLKRWENFENKIAF